MSNPATKKSDQERIAELEEQLDDEQYEHRMTKSAIQNLEKLEEKMKHMVMKNSKKFEDLETRLEKVESPVKIDDKELMEQLKIENEELKNLLKIKDEQLSSMRIKLVETENVLIQKIRECEVLKASRSGRRDGQHSVVYVDSDDIDDDPHMDGDMNNPEVRMARVRRIREGQQEQFQAHFEEK